MPELTRKPGAKPGAEVLVFFSTRRAELERFAHRIVDNKSAPIDETWQVLRFVYRREDR